MKELFKRTIASIIIMLNPFEAVSSFTTLLGVIIMVHAAICVIDMLMIKKDVGDLPKAFEKFIKDTN